MKVELESAAGDAENRGDVSWADNEGAELTDQADASAVRPELGAERGDGNAAGPPERPDPRPPRRDVRGGGDEHGEEEGRGDEEGAEEGREREEVAGEEEDVGGVERVGGQEGRGAEQVVEDGKHQRVDFSAGTVALHAQLCGHCRVALRRSCARCAAGLCLLLAATNS